MPRRKQTRQPQPQQFSWEEIEGATGASDANSGGGNASGNPSGDTAMTAGERVTRGNPRQDAAKLFPDRFGKKPGTRGKASGAKKTRPAAPEAKTPARKPAARKAAGAKTRSTTRRAAK